MFSPPGQPEDELGELMESNKSGVVSPEKVGKIYNETNALVELIHEG